MRAADSRVRVNRLAALGCAALGATLWSGVAATGQTSQPTGATIPYTDVTFGFEMQVPAGWRYDRGRFQGPKGAHGVLRGRNQESTQALQILIFRSLEDVRNPERDPPPFDQWLGTFKKQLGQLHKPLKITERKSEGGERPRAVLAVDPPVEGLRTITHYLCIQFDPYTVWVLALAGTVSGSAQAQALRARFDHLAVSVSVLYDPLEAREMAAAFERGLTVLKELRAGARAGKIPKWDRYYDIAIGGKSIGYLRRRVRREWQELSDPRVSSKRREGLRVEEESWRFADDGTVRCTELNMFSSLDLHSEMIENRTTQVPAPDVESQRLYIELDQCIREDNALISSFSTNLDVNLPDPRPPIPIGPRYLDLAWVRLLPSLLLKAPSDAYAFAIYDSQARALTVHTIRPLGPCRPAGPSGSAGCLFETRDGFAAWPSRVYTDQQGAVVRIESGDLVIALTTLGEVERKYAARREPARRRMELPKRGTP